MIIDNNKKRHGVDNVQRVYAQILENVSHVGFALLIGGYFVYIFQLMPLSVPIDAIAQNWHLSAATMQQKLNTPSGWSFFGSTSLLMKGDVVSSLSIYYLATATIFCLLFAIPAYIREKNYIYTTISLFQIVVLLVAASGIIN